MMRTWAKSSPMGVCVVFENSEGKELSFSFQSWRYNSEGKLSRLSSAVFQGDQTLLDDSPVGGPTEFLNQLAEHLGYRVFKKSPGDSEVESVHSE